MALARQEEESEINPNETGGYLLKDLNPFALATITGGQVYLPENPRIIDYQQLDARLYLEMGSLILYGPENGRNSRIKTEISLQDTRVIIGDGAAMFVFPAVSSPDRKETFSTLVISKEHGIVELRQTREQVVDELIISAAYQAARDLDQKRLEKKVSFAIPRPVESS